MVAEIKASLPVVGYHECGNWGFTSCGGVLWIQKLRLYCLWWGIMDAEIKGALSVLGYPGCRNEGPLCWEYRLSKVPYLKS